MMLFNKLKNNFSKEKKILCKNIHLSLILKIFKIYNLLKNRVYYKFVTSIIMRIYQKSIFLHADLLFV